MATFNDKCFEIFHFLEGLSIPIYNFFNRGEVKMYDFSITCPLLTQKKGK